MPSYSIRGLMLFTLGIAGGLAAARGVESLGFSFPGFEATTHLFLDRALAVLTCCLMIWVATGLFYQAWDIRMYLRDKRGLPARQVSALRFDLTWRIGLVTLFPLTYAFEATGKALRPEADLYTGLPGFFAEAHFPDLRWLLLLVAIGVGGGFRSRASRQPGALKPLVNFLVWLAALLLIALVVFNESMVNSLVYVALNGVEAAEPLAWRRAPVGLELLHAEQCFLKVAVLQFAALTAALVCTAWLAFGNRISRWRGIPLLATALVAIVVVFRSEASARFHGLAQISPSFAEVWTRFPPLPLVLMFMVVVTYLAARAATRHRDTTPVTWRTHSSAYLHESPQILALAGLLSLVRLAYAVESFALIFSAAEWSHGLYRILSYVTYYWPMAMLLLVAQRLLQRWKRREDNFITPDFSWRTFGGYWLLFAALCGAIAAMANTFCLAIWLPVGWF